LNLFAVVFVPSICPIGLKTPPDKLLTELTTVTGVKTAASGMKIGIFLNFKCESTKKNRLAAVLSYSETLTD